MIAGLDPPVADPQRAVGELGDVRVVRDEQNRHAALAAEREQELDDLPAGRRVESARSARRRAGAAARSRAPARSPPAGAHRRTASSGSAARVAAMAQSSSAARRPLSRSPRASPRPIIGTWTFSAAFSVGIRWWNWKTKPTVAARYSAGSSSVSTARRRRRSSPQSGRSSAPIRFRSVLLPQPEGPVTETKSPWLDARRCRRARRCAVFERLGDVVDDHLDAARARAHRASTQYLTARVPSAERTVTRNTIRNPLDESGNLT